MTPPAAKKQKTSVSSAKKILVRKSPAKKVANSKSQAKQKTVPQFEISDIVIVRFENDATLDDKVVQRDRIGYWPGQIVEPSQAMVTGDMPTDGNVYTVFFFGDHAHEWVPESKLLKFEPKLLTCETALSNLALHELDDYLR